MSTLSLAGGTTVYITKSGSNYQYSSNQTIWTNTSLPLTLVNSSPSNGVLVVELADMTLTAATDYFICGSSKIQFGSTSLKTDGTRPVITIEGVTGYPGLIQNGISLSNGYSNIYIYNLLVTATITSTLPVSSGWIGQQYFGRAAGDNYIINCSSVGPISPAGGGIVGESAGTTFGAILTLIGCSSSGTIGSSGGGIVGFGAGSFGGSVTCTSCWSTGTIGQSAGGITGSSSQACIIRDCYSTGSIGNTGGGICGSSCGSFTSQLSVTNCYSTGQIGGSAGGIVGRSSTNITVANCYSLGDMADNNSGGIFGIPQFSYTITNCYAVGSFTGTGPGVVGYIIGNVATIPPSCYSERNSGTPGTWSSINANSVLLGLPSPVVGTTWVVTASGPYELLNMGYTPYTIANITSTPSLARQFLLTMSAGRSSLPAIISGKTYTSLQITGGDATSYSLITIDSTTGIISASSSSVNGVYTMYVRNTGTYAITPYILTIIDGIEGSGGSVIVVDSGSTTLTCCEKPTFRRGLLIDHATYIGLLAGNTFLGSVRRGPIPYYQILAMKKALASKQ